MKSLTDREMAKAVRSGGFVHPLPKTPTATPRCECGRVISANKTYCRTCAEDRGAIGLTEERAQERG